jgi:hypothetical protein
MGIFCSTKIKINNELASVKIIKKLNLTIAGKAICSEAAWQSVTIG